MPQSLDRVSCGIFAGAIATGPMTLAMFNMFKELPCEQQSPLPPATLSYETAEMTGAADELSPAQEAWLAMLSHFTYGAATGLVYANTLGRLPGSPVLKGSAYGLAVWAASYMGWIPVVGFRSQAPQMTARRNGMMIAAHLIWGASLAYGEHHLRQRGLRMLAGHQKAPEAE